MSGVSASLIWPIRSRKASLRFFSLASCNWSWTADALQGFDRRVEVAMLLPQTGQFALELLPVGTIGALCHPLPPFSRPLPEAKAPTLRALRKGGAGLGVSRQASPKAKAARGPGGLDALILKGPQVTQAPAPHASH